MITPSPRSKLFRVFASVILFLILKNPQVLRAQTAGDADHRIAQSGLAAPRAEIATESTFTADQRETMRLSAKGRSQYLAGDSEGARATFRQVEMRDPEST